MFAIRKKSSNKYRKQLLNAANKTVLDALEPSIKQLKQQVKQ